MAARHRIVLSAGWAIGLLAILGPAAAIGEELKSSQGDGASVLTQHNDNYRTGVNLQETELTPEAVKKSFGRLFDLGVDGQIYTQPLVVSGVEIEGEASELVLVGTQNNSLYAFNPDTQETLWRVNYGEPVPTPNPAWNHPWGFYTDLTPMVGIVSTPAIDAASNTIYFTRPSWDGKELKSMRWLLHAVDLRDGSEKYGGPVEISGSISVIYHEGGRGKSAASPRSTFRPDWHLQRTGLLLDRGKVVLAFASHGDKQPYQGWVFSYDASTLEQTGVWSSIAGGPVTNLHYSGAGIWQSGMGLTVDPDGSIYLITGNGFFDEFYRSFGDSFVKLRPGDLHAEDYFTPCNQDCLNKYDIDLGASGVLYLPGTDLIVGGGKQARLYVLNRKRLGGFDPSQRSQWVCQLDDPEEVDFECRNPNVVQEFQARGTELKKPTEWIHIHGSPVYWQSDHPDRGAMIYVWSEDSEIRAFQFDQNAGKAPKGRFVVPKPGMKPPKWSVGRATSPGYLHLGMTGGMLSVSANKGRDGIVWAMTPTNNNANPKIVPGILRAYDANDLSDELWNSYEVRDRDDFGNYAKFTAPTIANGRVYVPTFSNHLSVYGLHPPSPPKTPDNLIQNGGFEDQKAGWKSEPSALFSVDNCYPYYGKIEGRLSPMGVNKSIDRQIGLDKPGQERKRGVDHCHLSVPTSPAPGEGMLYQEIRADRTGVFELSAYGSTNILDGGVVPTSRYRHVTLGVDVDGRTVATKKEILPYAGYLKYSFLFQANQGSTVKVWYYVPEVQPVPDFETLPSDQPVPYAVIDNVSLTFQAPERP